MEKIRLSVSPMLRRPVSLFQGLFVFLSLFLLVSQSAGALYVFTDQGRLARSTDDGITWSWVSTPLPGNDCVDMTSDPYRFIYILTRTGEVHRSINYGSSWTSRGNIAVPDAKAIWVITGLTFVLTQTGDLYERNNATGNWSLLGNIGASDFVDFVPRPDGNSYLAFTRSGDVWQVLPTPFTKSLISNIGSSTIVGATTLTNAVIVVTEEGDIARSTNGGVSWSWVGAISQMPIAGIGNKGNNIYVTTQTGEVLRSTNQGSNWLHQGNISQIGIKGITSDTMIVIGAEETKEQQVLQIFGVYPNPSSGRFTIKFFATKTGAGRLRLFDISGSEVGELWGGAISLGDNVLEIRVGRSGVYFLMLESDEARATAKIILTRE